MNNFKKFASTPSDASLSVSATEGKSSLSTSEPKYDNAGGCLKLSILTIMVIGLMVALILILGTPRR